MSARTSGGKRHHAQLRATLGEDGYRQQQQARGRTGGKRHHAQLRATLGEDGYRQRQQALGRKGGQSRQAQLRATLGEDGYRQHQQHLYQQAVAKHGEERMRTILTTAHEQRRCGRIANPTPAEALLHWLALTTGFTLHADLAGGFAWEHYRAEPARWPFTETDALIEARVYRFACDLLLPTHALVIEVLGGIHALTTTRDEARFAALQAEGLTVVTFTNEQIYCGEADQLFAALLEHRHAA